MARISLRIDDDLSDRLYRRARRAGVTLTDLLRPALENVADPRAGYIFSSQDEILGVSLQTLSILATAVRDLAPEALEQGMAEARARLQGKGLPVLEVGALRADAAAQSTPAAPPDGQTPLVLGPSRGEARR